ncbi:MAG: hypothetical protein H7Y31_06310 [Chitinophagaceae bacterium]|nr:hypothetical protein [Chitinophagaceae bacterium]
MLQPFEIFRPEYVTKLLSLKKRYLVSQSYARFSDRPGDEQKTGLLVSEYQDPGLAKVHFNAVRNDKFAAILDLENPAHRNKFESMLSVESLYRIFWSVVKSTKELEALVNHKYKDHMRRYIDRNTNWRLNRDSGIKPSLQVIFGELYLILKHAGQTIRIKFEEIESS